MSKIAHRGLECARHKEGFLLSSSCFFNDLSSSEAFTVAVLYAHLEGSMDFPGGSVVKNPFASAGDMGLIPGSGGSPGEGNGNTLQYFCLDRGVWRPTVHGVAKELDTTQRLKQ